MLVVITLRAGAGVRLVCFCSRGAISRRAMCRNRRHGDTKKQVALGDGRLMLVQPVGNQNGQQPVVALPTR
jgi:hypothetical protein